MRTSGILCPVSSISSKYGIGCFSKEAYEFVDFLRDAGQSYWQVLPFGPTSFGDSPYQSFSTFAGNPYFIDLETLREEGLLTWEELSGYDFGSDPGFVDYGAIYSSRFGALRIAFWRFKANPDKEYAAFLKKNAFWLDDFALFMALKEKNGGASWAEWPDELRNRDAEALKAAKAELADEIDFYRFQQYEFEKQWDKLHAYALSQGVRIIGDIPFYTAFDSSDSWANPKMFLFDENNVPVKVAGCPPDAFSADGQLWGNPIYNWTYMKRTKYSWWIKRIRRCVELCDVLRVDHFRAFDEYYEIPYGEPTAKNGVWKPGPGIGLFNEVEKQIGKVEIIAEDLGYITESVRKLVDETGFPGMKVLEFAFDPREESDYLPHNYVQNSVVYTGTHDNETVRGWVENLSDADRDFARKYIRSEYTDYNAFTWDFIRTACASVSDTCIVPIQDYLCKGNEARINHPSTTGTNWKWRLRPNELSGDLAKSIYDMTKLYCRLSDFKKKAEAEEAARIAAEKKKQDIEWRVNEKLEALRSRGEQADEAKVRAEVAYEDRRMEELAAESKAKGAFFSAEDALMIVRQELAEGKAFE